MSGSIGVNLSICISDIPKEFIRKADNGKHYVNLNAFISSEANTFTTKKGKVLSDNGGITLPQTEEQRKSGEKRVFVGNTRIYWSNEEPMILSKKEEAAVTEPEDDDLPEWLR